MLLERQEGTCRLGRVEQKDREEAVVVVVVVVVAAAGMAAAIA